MKTVTAYKAFDAEFACQGFKYEVGKTYKHSGDVKVCESGFHACLNPWDTLLYKDLIQADGRLGRFATVFQSGKTESYSKDSKIASAEITIRAELSFSQFVELAVQWLVDFTRGNGARIGSSGNGARIVVSGSEGVIAAAGRNTTARGTAGTWISLAEYNNHGKCVGFATGQIGKDGLTENVSYVARDGKLVKADT